MENKQKGLPLTPGNTSESWRIWGWQDSNLSEERLAWYSDSEFLLLPLVSFVWKPLSFCFLSLFELPKISLASPFSAPTLLSSFSPKPAAFLSSTPALDYLSKLSLWFLFLAVFQILQPPPLSLCMHLLPFQICSRHFQSLFPPLLFLFPLNPVCSPPENS